MSEINLQGYMSSAIRRIMAKAYRNVLTLGVKGALQSPLFKKLRAVHLVGGEHSGGCALWEHREEVKEMVK